MNFKSLKLVGLLSVTLIASTIFISCGDPKKSTDPEKMPGNDTSGGLVEINGQIISIPSPIQTAFLINKVGANYSKEMLNPANKTANYTTNFQKALNLGVFGADLGYVTIYDQTQDALSYMNATKKIADELGVSGAFSPATMERFQKNMGNRDSLLSLVSVAYRESDSYLKNNEQNNISGLILTGGWIETMYFVTNILKSKDNDEIKRRIGEQKSSVSSIIKLLTPYAGDAAYADLISKIKELEAAFAGIEFKYTYQKPLTDPEKKMTTITSTSEVKISAEQIKTITDKVDAIRKQIVG